MQAAKLLFSCILESTVKSNKVFSLKLSEK
jgi:hypothetical protein